MYTYTSAISTQKSELSLKYTKISSMDTETTDKVKRINLLFDMIKDAQKSFW